MSSWADTVKTLYEHSEFPKDKRQLSELVNFLRNCTEIPVGIVLVDGEISDHSFTQFMRFCMGFASENFVFYVSQGAAHVAVTKGDETLILGIGVSVYNIEYQLISHASDPAIIKGHMQCSNDSDLATAWERLLQLLT